ncbi:MAG: YbaN family protein [Bacteroidales bacterium]|nr:YbaN family protein [Bacteroidales bacterium]
MKYLYSFLGSLSLILGIVGIFVPVLPTTPFLLLSAALYFKGSKKLYNWLMGHPRLGPYISNFRIYKAIPLKAKICSISLLWLTILFSAIFVVSVFWVKVLLIGVAVAVTIHILSFKTLK